eukprot:1247247-Rhodomonas_salina.3
MMLLRFRRTRTATSTAESRLAVRLHVRKHCEPVPISNHRAVASAQHLLRRLRAHTSRTLLLSCAEALERITDQRAHHARGAPRELAVGPAERRVVEVDEGGVLVEAH